MAQELATTDKNWKVMSVPEKTRSFKDLLESNRNQVEKALPRHVSADRMLKVALSAVTTNPKLMECSKYSLITAIMQCAELGLEPNSILGHAYMIPFKDRATVIVGYKGYLELASRSDRIVSVEARLRYEGDDFKLVYGIRNEFTHTPAALCNPPRERGKILHGYSVIRIRGAEDQPLIEIMSIEDLEKRRKASLMKDSKIWRDWTEDMYVKTLIRHGLKYAPISVEIGQAMEMDAQGDSGELQVLDDELLEGMSKEVQADYKVENNGKSASDKLADKLDN